MFAIIIDYNPGSTLNSGIASGSSRDFDDIWDSVRRKLLIEFPLLNFGRESASSIMWRWKRLRIVQKRKGF